MIQQIFMCEFVPLLLARSQIIILCSDMLTTVVTFVSLAKFDYYRR